MTYPPRRLLGFTLIELMVTIAVVLTFAILAVPSFQSLRQRSALRGAGDQMLSLWNQARFEAAKRNSNVKVAIVQSSNGAAYCFGAATTASVSVTTSCNCFDAAASTDACNVILYPGTATSDTTLAWSRVKLSGVTLGGSNWPTVSAIGQAVIEPKRTALTASSAAGTVTLDGPALSNKAYKLRLSVDQFGRGMLCEPNSAVDKLSDYHNQRCP